MQAAVERFGRLDTAFNNAGIEQPAKAAEISDDEWDRLFAVNLRGAFLSMKHEKAPVSARVKTQREPAALGDAVGASGRVTQTVTRLPSRA